MKASGCYKITYRASGFQGQRTKMMVNHPNRNKRNPAPIPPMTEQKFVAKYEDAAKSAAEAKRHGWTEEDGGMLDFLNGDPPRSARVFVTKAEALAWLLAEIEAGKTLFGCGDLNVMEPVKRRCRYCVCNGWRMAESFIVDNDGVTEERDLRDDCN